ncbi:MAG: DNA gyrase subunit A [Bacilli bacterium]|nr:DNA gyrase subunit A [Bacilli bacterium]
MSEKDYFFDDDNNLEEEKPKYVEDDEDVVVDIPEHIEGHHNGGIREIDLNTEMRKSFLSYAMSVIVSRAIPDVRDGLKPVHRRILYGMNELSVYPNTPHKKSARIVGEVMGKYHPHGDSAIYESMVRMAQDFSYRYPLVDGHGNFGSIDGDSPAAMRYTEARMSKAAMELLRDLDKNTVDFADNYDGSEQEPTVLPCKFPNLLVNGASGIAVGMATNIPPHNLGEVIDAILAIMKSPDITIEGIMGYIKGPDFPTGGCIMGISQVRKAYMTGTGTIAVRAKAEIKTTDGGRPEIIVSEIPYGINKTRILERIAETVKDKIIDGITDLRDISNRDGIKIVIELRKDANPNVILNNLYKHTQLQSTFGINMLALHKGQPKVMNIKEMLNYYIEHQIEVVTRRTQFELDKAEARAHILEGLLIALTDIDAVIQLIKKAKTGEEAMAGLMKQFKLTEIQSKAILDMKLQRITGIEIDKVKEEYAEKKRVIHECKEILKSTDRKEKIVAQELTEVKNKFGDKRRTEIGLSDELDIEDEDLIPVEDVIITVTNKGYVKRLTTDTYRVQNRGGKGISGAKMNDDDFVEKVIYTSSHDTLLFFTSLGMVYKLRAFQIPTYSRLAKGLPIVNLLNLDPNEKLAAVLCVREKEPEGFFIFGTRGGIVKKTAISEFKNIRTNGIKAILLNEGDELFTVAMTDGEKDIVLAASSGKGIRFSESDIRPMGRISAGVRGIKVESPEKMIGMAIVNTDGDEIVMVTDKGYGKRTNVDSFRVQVRGGKGVKSINMTSKNGKLVSLAAIRGDEDLMIITDKGMIIRTRLDQILTVGRDAQGVKVIALNDKQYVTNIAIVPHVEEEVEEDTQDIDLDLNYQFIDERENEQND